MQHFRIGCRLAVAPTPGAAWALAFAKIKTRRDEAHEEREKTKSISSSCSSSLRVNPSSKPIERPIIVEQHASLPALLAPLPTIALRIDPQTALSLNHLGIHTIGQLMKLPRNALPARFGSELLTKLDQALGNVAEPLVPLEPFSPIQARMDFEGAVDSIEAIWIVFKRLLTRIVPELLKRGHGARELQIEFYRPYAVTLHKTINLSRPSRDPSNLFNLLRCAMETIETDVGYLGIKLLVSRSQRVSDQQIQLLEHEEFIAETELSHLIERLRIRLGNQIIAQPSLIESYVPEKAFTCHGLLAHASSTAVQNVSQTETIRPLHLLKTPQEIGVIVSPSHDREGSPISFTWKGKVHRLPHTTGPERIAGQWWEGHHKTRDYFDTETASGQRFWIFRVLETGKWYVHGEYE